MNKTQIDIDRGQFNVSRFLQVTQYEPKATLG